MGGGTIRCSFSLHHLTLYILSYTFFCCNVQGLMFVGGFVHLPAKTSGSEIYLHKVYFYYVNCSFY